MSTLERVCIIATTAPPDWDGNMRTKWRELVPAVERVNEGVYKHYRKITPTVPARFSSCLLSMESA